VDRVGEQRHTAADDYNDYLENGCDDESRERDFQCPHTAICGEVGVERGLLVPVRVRGKEFLQPADHGVFGMRVLVIVLMSIILMIMVVVVMLVLVSHKEPPKKKCRVRVAQRPSYFL
jgi:hypothetical protein